MVSSLFQYLSKGRCDVVRGPSRLIAPNMPTIVPSVCRLMPLWPVRHARYSVSLVMRSQISRPS